MNLCVMREIHGANETMRGEYLMFLQTVETGRVNYTSCHSPVDNHNKKRSNFFSKTNEVSGSRAHCVRKKELRASVPERKCRE